MKKLALLSTVAAVVMVASPAFAAPELVQNGDFSTTTTSSSSGNFQLTTGNTYGSVANWTTSGSNSYNLLFNASNATSASGNAAGQYSGTGLEYLNTMPAGTTGKFLALDGDTNVNGAVSQLINGLVIGQQYSLQFDWATSSIASRSGAQTDGLTVTFGSQSFSTGQVAIPTTSWTHVTRAFTATSTSQLLSFLSIGAPNGQPPVALLDNVSVRAVPEPATWAMMLAGFGMVGGVARYRRRKTLVATA